MSRFFRALNILAEINVVSVAQSVRALLADTVSEYFYRVIRPGAGRYFIRIFLEY